jgi:ornithine decarboxylase
VKLSQPGLAKISLPRSLQEEYNVQAISASTSTRDNIRAIIEANTIDEGPFYIVDLGVLVRKYEQWVELLPRVKPFYAVKCNPHPALIKVLAACGSGFDCASEGEIRQVLSYGVEAERIIMANPCKPPSHIRAARSVGVSMMTFDNADELRKIHRHYPDAELVLRMLPDDSHSVMRFGSKFGAPPSTWASLFQLASELKLKVTGVSFHVGSGCMSAKAFTEALRLARKVFDTAASYGYTLSLLDIGGGFPGGENGGVTFPEIANAMRPTLDALFPPEVTVIGEPGRYFASETHALAVSIYARRHIEPEAHDVPGASADLRYLYYVNDGVYGSFNCIFFDHAHPTPLPLNEPAAHAATFPSNVFGPTCDSLDVIARNTALPELHVGDWLYFESMGAYTTAAASAFNGFKTTSMFYVYSVPDERLLSD